MREKDTDDVKDMMQKLEKIRSYCPSDYYYVKGWVHCLLYKEEKIGKHCQKPPKETV